MPTYDYKCNKCSYTFEVFQSITAEPIKVCPQCNGEVKRIIGPGLGPIFKGKGFYQTDYKSPSSAKKDKGTETEGKNKTDTSVNDTSPKKNSGESK